jgi:hypothetical protein
MRSSTVTMSDMCQLYTQFKNKVYRTLSAGCSYYGIYKKLGNSMGRVLHGKQSVPEIVKRTSEFYFTKHQRVYYRVENRPALVRNLSQSS